MSLRTHGLVNKTGENNCFINSVIQALWHLDVFRKQFSGIGHSCLKQEADQDPDQEDPRTEVETSSIAKSTTGSDIKEECFVCALTSLFANLQYSNEVSIPPNQLRDTLAHIFAKGKLHSAMECFEQVFKQLESKPDSMRLVSSLFNLNLCGQKRCQKCRASNEPSPESPRVFSSLVADEFTKSHSLFATLSNRQKPKFEAIVKKNLVFNAEERYECPNEEQKCWGKPARNCVYLFEKPDVFSLCFNWRNEYEAQSSIDNFMGNISPKITIENLFDQPRTAPKMTTNYALNGVIVYYGKHYTCYVYHSSKKKWIYCDDERVKVVQKGRWSDVVANCVKGRKQIEMLIYSKIS